jgi:hypothetical protein
MIAFHLLVADSLLSCFFLCLLLLGVFAPLTATTAQPTEAFPVCEGRACNRNEFCGQDLNCHLYTCENMYNFGPYNFTGRVFDGNNNESSTTTPPPRPSHLTCSYVLPPNSMCEELVHPGSSQQPVSSTAATTTDEMKWPIAVQPFCYPQSVYPLWHTRCAAGIVSDGISLQQKGSENLPTLRYNRYCTTAASSSGGGGGAPTSDALTFSCFDLDVSVGNDNNNVTYDILTAFLNETRLLPNCTASNSPYEYGEDDKNLSYTFVWRQNADTCMDGLEGSACVSLEESDFPYAMMLSRVDSNPNFDASTAGTNGASTAGTDVAASSSAWVATSIALLVSILPVMSMLL